MITSAQKLLMARAGAGVSANPSAEYVGSVTKSALNSTDFDTAEESLDVLSIAEVGDLVVIAITTDTSGDDTFSWEGMPFSNIYTLMATGNPNVYVGYRVVQAGDTNPYVSGVSGWDYLSIVASVFRNANTYLGYQVASGTGLPDPPSLAASGRLWVITGHLDDDHVTDWVAPSNYTLAASEISAGSVASGASSTVLAYRIEDLSSDDPGGFSGTGDDQWRALTLAFS